MGISIFSKQHHFLFAAKLILQEHTFPLQIILKPNVEKIIVEKGN